MFVIFVCVKNNITFEREDVIISRTEEQNMFYTYNLTSLLTSSLFYSNNFLSFVNKAFTFQALTTQIENIQDNLYLLTILEKNQKELDQQVWFLF